MGEMIQVLNPEKALSQFGMSNSAAHLPLVLSENSSVG